MTRVKAHRIADADGKNTSASGYSPHCRPLAIAAASNVHGAVCARLHVYFSDGRGMRRGETCETAIPLSAGAQRICFEQNESVPHRRHQKHLCQQLCAAPSDRVPAASNMRGAVVRICTHISATEEVCGGGKHARARRCFLTEHRGFASNGMRAHRPTDATTRTPPSSFTCRTVVHLRSCRG